MSRYKKHLLKMLKLRLSLSLRKNLLCLFKFLLIFVNLFRRQSSRKYQNLSKFVHKQIVGFLRMAKKNPKFSIKIKRLLSLLLLKFITFVTSLLLLERERQHNLEQILYLMQKVLQTNLPIELKISKPQENSQAESQEDSCL